MLLNFFRKSFIDFLYKPTIKPFDMKKIFGYLEELNSYFENIIYSIDNYKYKKLSSSKLSRSKGITGETNIPEKIVQKCRIKNLRKSKKIEKLEKLEKINKSNKSRKLRKTNKDILLL